MLVQNTVTLWHVVSMVLIRAMCGLFRATESWVAQSLVCEYWRAKVRQVVYT